MSKKISRFVAQRRLAILWFVGSGVLIVVFFFLYILNRLNPNDIEGQYNVGWDWLLPNIAPILTLMIGTFISNVNKSSNERAIKGFYYKLAYGISLFYLLMLLGIVIAIPAIIVYSKVTVIDYLQNTKTFLIVFQGINTSVLGLFFAKDV